MPVKQILLVALGIITCAHVLYWFANLRREWISRSQATSDGESGANPPLQPGPVHLFIGFVTDFLDTLGISSFATTTALFQSLRKSSRIGSFRNTECQGHLLPTVVQAFLYMGFVQVDPQTLVLLIVASVAGAWLGAGVVAGWSKRKVQIGMGIALLCATVLMLMKQFEWFPGGGDKLGITGMTLLIGVVGNFFLGALMTLGIGLYAPCMIMISLLGMNPKAAFPIMMGSCAFPDAGVQPSDLFARRATIHGHRSVSHWAGCQPSYWRRFSLNRYLWKLSAGSSS